MPILHDQSLEFISRSEEQTRRLGMRIGAMLAQGDVICLEGDLGSGKTTLVQGMVVGWGSLDQATSPTFVLMNVYRHPDGRRFYHLDAYRIENVREAMDLDILSFVETGPLVVEWAERIRQALPPEHLWVNITSVNEQQRDFVFRIQGDHYQAMLNKLRKQFYGIR